MMTSRFTVLLSFALIGAVVMMVLPVPSHVVDIGLALSFSLSILMLMVTLFIERPLDFSAFPTVLLSSLLLRLALNVSSTKLIIGQGHTGTDAAGHVIAGFARFVMGGDFVLGLVIFLVLMIVNFVVITKGAGRMAEVGARFALDGMPGRQLAIDADMSAGAIDHAEAKHRREMELAETTFFGSLDGASKFVKGDAIAGLLITFLNLIVGLIVGVLVHGMDISIALETYAILTVGDGLVSQMPAVITSIAAALLLSRGGLKGAADVSFFHQLGRYPAALASVAVIMAVFAVVPGLPFLPFVLLALVTGLAAWNSARPRAGPAEAERESIQPARRSIGDVLDFDEIHVEFASDLVPMVLDPSMGLDGRITSMRNHVAAAYGLVLPEIRLTDEITLSAATYRILIQGVERAKGRLVADRVLVLLGEDGAAPEGEIVQEPVYGAAARWIRPEAREDAIVAGLTVVTPVEVLATHLLEVIKANMAHLLSLRGLRRLLDEFANVSDRTRAEGNRRLIEDLVPDKIPMDLLHSVLRLLLEERVSIRNLPLILEALAEARHLGAADVICEHVRQRLGFQIVAAHRRADGAIPLVQLAPEWERTFQEYQIDGPAGARDVALPPELFTRLANGIAEKVARASQDGVLPALVTSAMRRRFLRTVVQAKGIGVPVLSYEEIGPDSRPTLLGQVAA